MRLNRALDGRRGARTQFHAALDRGLKRLREIDFTYLTDDQLSGYTGCWHIISKNMVVQ